MQNVYGYAIQSPEEIQVKLDAVRGQCRRLLDQYDTTRAKFDVLNNQVLALEAQMLQLNERIARHDQSRSKYLTQAETAEWESLLSGLQAERQKIVGERAALISKREPLRMECLQLSNALVNAQYRERTLENLLPESVVGALTPPV